MTCTRCGKDLEPGAAFCPHCGAAVDSRAGAGAAAPRRLVRRPAEGRLAGVCAGIAAYLDADVTLVRLAWVILSIVPGGFIGGVLGYAAAWLVMPEPTAADVLVPLRRTVTRSIRDQKIAGVCGGIAEYFAIDPTVVRVVWAVLTVVPGAIVLGLVAYVIAWFIMPEGTSASAAAAPTAA
jgi:phage shock protein PspC (stress-responsive transcriptional regulator)